VLLFEALVPNQGINYPSWVMGHFGNGLGFLISQAQPNKTKNRKTGQAVVRRIN